MGTWSGVWRLGFLEDDLAWGLGGTVFLASTSQGHEGMDVQMESPPGSTADVQCWEVMPMAGLAWHAHSAFAAETYRHSPLLDSTAQHSIAIVMELEGRPIRHCIKHHARDTYRF